MKFYSFMEKLFYPKNPKQIQAQKEFISNNQVKFHADAGRIK